MVAYIRFLIGQHLCDLCHYMLWNAISNICHTDPSKTTYALCPLYWNALLVSLKRKKKKQQFSLKTPNSFPICSCTIKTQTISQNPVQKLKLLVKRVQKMDKKAYVSHVASQQGSACMKMHK